ncbi:type I-F CRISPR-associated protein Csy1 [Halorhodospira halophila]|uniref:type I-F CRISPR-associated protein Csy1 n=1 Tax=Halorhodospira halophila TaxID=1053 RepID=UPI0019129AC1|nr:type I-F CRISPR-associated protein Csy1 [Halorhodospira halophila]MBK5935500.1 type I-F CRISPR-associated protein Csy1 [Halorhodospira halophila]
MNDESVQRLRQILSEFLEKRLNDKLSKLSKNDAERECKERKLRVRFGREVWVADAVKRISHEKDTRLQIVTHPAKATHPSSRSSSVYKPPPELHSHRLVGSHVLGKNFALDASNDSRSLDVFAFLKLEYQGRSFFDLALEQKPELASALSDDFEQGMNWVRALADVFRSPGGEKMDHRAKQVYWLVGDNPNRDADFYLLAPLYSSVLAQRIYDRVSHDRFSDEAKQARKAFRSRGYSEHEHREYPSLAAQALGGRQPQNVSQLNSERGGTNYLLGSLPPKWRSAAKPLLHTNSALSTFGRRYSVRQTVHELEQFLLQNPRPNVATRQRRDALVAALADELLAFAAQFQELEPGWSADPACQLPDEEALWLDPERVSIDPNFARRRGSLDGANSVPERFAAWLNQQLRQSLPVEDAERRHWERQLKHETDSLREVWTHA